MTEAEPRLVDTGGGCTISYRGKTLYSPHAPETAAVRRVQKLAVQPGSLIFVPSVGLGYGLQELLQKLPESCHILCIEVDERLFKLALSQEPPLPKDPRLTIIRTDGPEQAAAVVQQLGTWRFRRVLALHLCGGYQLYRRKYKELQEVVEEEIRSFWQNKITLVAMTRLWLKNLFINLRCLPTAADISDLATDRPILVCGAGPSLETTLEWIEGIREKVILMAVDTALPVLAAANLPPDWVFTLDAQVYTLLDFLPFRDPGIKLLCDLTSHPQSLRLFPELYFFSSRFHPLSLFDRLKTASLLPTQFAPRGSVGVSAVEAALAVTTGPVLFTGLDFSYPDGKTHARGAPFHLTVLEQYNRLQPGGQNIYEALLIRPRLWMKDGKGERLLSDLVLQSYARQLSGIISNNRRCYHLGGRGLITGTQKIESLNRLLQVCSRWVRQRSPEKPEPGGCTAATTETMIRFCDREQRLLARVIRSTDPSNLSKAVVPVEYLLLSQPEVDPERQVAAWNIGRIQAQARRLSLYLQQTQEASQL